MNVCCCRCISVWLLNCKKCHKISSLNICVQAILKKTCETLRTRNQPLSNIVYTYICINWQDVKQVIMQKWKHIITCLKSILERKCHLGCQSEEIIYFPKLLVSSLFALLQEPKIVCFGAGHKTETNYWECRKQEFYLLLSTKKLDLVVRFFSLCILT
jgi:hypothetical protein